ncbi:Glycosyl hydrolases family 38 N-terminal domain-containing protein [Porphyromonadaceae bacterium KH3CP3RA]|nr:Glycosyl hydrolases family 38 N-terminal domain-containing protein [Porphyromonadaceae bacterium KH3CP3RA]
MAKIVFSFIVFFSTIHISSQNFTAWKIGEKDQSATEFKLAPFDYSKYNKEFGDRPVLLETGNSNNSELTPSGPAKLENTIGEINILKGSTEPALVYGKNNEIRQYVTIEIANGGKPQRVNLHVDDIPYEQLKLDSGINIIETSIPETMEKRDVKLSIASGREILAECIVKSYPVKHWTVYMVQHSHTDIGFTKPQTEVLADHIRYIDYVIEYCERTENEPDELKFKWLCEATWPVIEYLNSRPKEQVDKFIKYIRKGQIEVAGMFFNMSELVDENSFKTFLEPIRQLRKLDIPVKTAMQNDVNGIAWCLADYMPDLGIHYFSMGQNSHRALLPFDCPTVFKWESPSGKSSYFYRFDHYRTGNRWGISDKNIQNMAPLVFTYLNNLAEKGYPFDAVSVQYSGYHFNNSPPSLIPNAVIKEWNEKFASPKLQSSLFHEFMDYIVNKYDSEFPVFRAAYPDWWTDGFGSAARETATSRRTHADMIAVQGLLSIARTKGQPLPQDVHEKIRHAHTNLLFYDEHTFGAAESISDPMSESSQVQWAQKSSYAWEALKNAQGMYEAAGGLIPVNVPGEKIPTVTFYNTLNWSRSGIVELFLNNEIIPQNHSFKLVDDVGNELNSQLLYTKRDGVYYAVYAENIPPMGYKTYRIIVESGNAPSPSIPPFVDNIIENDYYKIVVDTANGSIKSLFDKDLDVEMIDSESPWLLGAFVYETLNNNRRQLEQYTLTEYTRESLDNMRLKPGHNGSLFKSFFIEGDSEGVEKRTGVKIEVRLFHNEKRIELIYTTRKSPNTEPDGIYVSFPFKLDDAKIYFEVQGGIVSSGENQIEGTASDWNTVQNFVSVRNNNSQFILGSNEIPLFQLGGIRTGQFQRKKSFDKPHVYSWVMNNYWTTNFRAYQEGEFRWSYYLTSTDDTSNIAATRFGWASRVPLYARVMPAGKKNSQPAEYSAFEMDGKNLLMTSCTPSKEEHFLLLNIREMNGESTELVIKDGDGNPYRFQIVNAIEEPLSDVVTSHSFAPFENKFIKIKL